VGVQNGLPKVQINRLVALGSVVTCVNLWDCGSTVVVLVAGTHTYMT